MGFFFRGVLGGRGIGRDIGGGGGSEEILGGGVCGGIGEDSRGRKGVCEHFGKEGG